MKRREISCVLTFTRAANSTGAPVRRGVKKTAYFWIAAYSLIAAIGYADSEAPPLAVFTQGQARIVSGGKTYLLPLRTGLLLIHGGIVLRYGLEKENPGGVDSRRELRVELLNVPGPGKYGNANINVLAWQAREGLDVNALMGKQDEEMTNLMAQAMAERNAVFDRKNSRCQIEFRRVGTAGVEGNLGCSGLVDSEGQTQVTLDAAQFSAR